MWCRVLQVLPMLDLTNVVLFSILVGVSYRFDADIYKWYNVIVQATFAVVILVRSGAASSP